MEQSLYIEFCKDTEAHILYNILQLLSQTDNVKKLQIEFTATISANSWLCALLMMDVKLVLGLTRMVIN